MFRDYKPVCNLWRLCNHFFILSNHNSYCNLRIVRITRLCVNEWKLQHPPQAPPGFELLKISSFKFPLPEQKLCSNAPLILFFIFFAQQPRLSTYWPIFKAYTSYIFSSKQFARKSELFARNVRLHILKIEHLYSTRKTQHFQFKLPTPARQGFPNPSGTGNGQMTVDGQEGRKGRGGGIWS